MISRPQLEQAEMDFTPKTTAAPVASMADVERLVGVLRAHGQMTAAEICEQLGLPASETNKRKIRAAAEAGRPGIVSFPNSSGYMLSAACNDAQKLACLAAWAEFRDKITRTEVLYRQHFHSLGLRP